MSAVARTEEWPSRSETVTKSTPSASRNDPWVWRSVCKLAPLGRPSRRQSWDTEEETELGFSGGRGASDLRPHARGSGPRKPSWIQRVADRAIQYSRDADRRPGRHG